MRSREDYSMDECGTMMVCPGSWKSVEEWGDALNLSGDDVEYLSPDFEEEEGVVRVSLPMYDSLRDFGMEAGPSEKEEEV